MYTPQKTKTELQASNCKKMTYDENSLTCALCSAVSFSQVDCNYFKFAIIFKIVVNSDKYKKLQ